MIIYIANKYGLVVGNNDDEKRGGRGRRHVPGEAGGGGSLRGVLKRGFRIRLRYSERKRGLAETARAERSALPAQPALS